MPTPRFRKYMHLYLPLIGVLSLAGWGLLPAPVPNASTRTPPAMANGGQALRGATFASAAQTVPSSKPPQSAPSATTASSAAIAALITQADRGERQASCRLAATLTNCSQIERLREALDISIQHAASDATGTDPRVVAGIARQQTQLREQEQLCGQLSPADLRQTRRRVLQAAERDTPWATLRYLTAPSLRNKYGLVELDAAVEFQQHALALLERTAMQGHELALRMLMQIYATGEFHNEDIALHQPPDLGKALAIARRLRASANPHDAADMDRKAQALATKASATERARAEAFYARLAKIPLTDAVSDRDYQLPGISACNG